MARDPALEALIEAGLRGQTGLVTKPMFGGLAWLCHGNLLCAARDEGMLVRLGAGRDGWALVVPGIAAMVMQGRPMPGWVRAGPEAARDDALRARLLAAALEFTAGLTAKPAPAPKRRTRP